MQAVLRCHAAHQLQAHCPASFGGLGDGVDGAACSAALRVTSNEKEASLLGGLPTGAMWILGCVLRRGLRTTLTAPFREAAHEDEARVLYDYSRWHGV